MLTADITDDDSKNPIRSLAYVQTERGTVGMSIVPRKSSALKTRSSGEILPTVAQLVTRWTSLERFVRRTNQRLMDAAVALEWSCCQT